MGCIKEEEKPHWGCACPPPAGGGRGAGPDAEVLGEGTVFSPPAPLGVLGAGEGPHGVDSPSPGKCSWWNGLGLGTRFFG